MALSFSRSRTPIATTQSASSRRGVQRNVKDDTMKKRFERPLTAQDLADLPDEAIDLSDIPEVTEEMFKRGRVVYPHERKKQLTVRLDPDIVDWFRAQGKGYQTHMNAVLRAYVRTRMQEEDKGA